MSRSKKIFAAFAFLFFLFLLFIVYDISTRTSFPGSQKDLDAPPTLHRDSVPGDSLRSDSLRGLSYKINEEGKVANATMPPLGRIDLLLNILAPF